MIASTTDTHELKRLRQEVRDLKAHVENLKHQRDALRAARPCHLNGCQYDALRKAPTPEQSAPKAVRFECKCGNTFAALDQMLHCKGKHR